MPNKIETFETRFLAAHPNWDKAMYDEASRAICEMDKEDFDKEEMQKGLIHNDYIYEE